VAGDHLVPVHRQHLLDRLFGLDRIEVEHAASRHGADGDEVDCEQDLLLGQSHDECAIGVVRAEVVQLERRVPKRDRARGVDRLVRQDRVRIPQREKPLLGPRVRDDRGARILERLAARDVVEVLVAVDQVLDRLARDLLDLVDVGDDSLWAAVPDGSVAMTPAEVTTNIDW